MGVCRTNMRCFLIDVTSTDCKMYCCLVLKCNIFLNTVEILQCPLLFLVLMFPFLSRLSVSPFLSVSMSFHSQVSGQDPSIWVSSASSPALPAHLPLIGSLPSPQICCLNTPVPHSVFVRLSVNPAW